MSVENCDIKKILIVDDDPKVCESIRLCLETPYEIVAAESAEQAFDVLNTIKINLILLDIRLSGAMDGLEVLRRIKENEDDTPVIMISATNLADVAVRAMKLGAIDYVTKPFHPEELSILIEKALQNTKNVRELNYLRKEIKDLTFEHLVGTSKKMEPVYTMIKKMCQNEATVLITGESGTGKELVARAIHYEGTRRNGPFVTINCAAIPENLLESEMFGHEKGAFTGAGNIKPGKFEIADGGTLFLDEISCLKKDMQSKILRVLQEWEFERIGGLKTIKVNVRLITASNANLKKAISEGRFREDLFYRINVVPIHLPPLRERKNDIPLLCEYFMTKYNQKFNKSIQSIAADGLTLLGQYHWPGNIRELENMIERLVALCDHEIIGLVDLPLELFVQSSLRATMPLNGNNNLKEALQKFERELIQRILNRCQGNHSQACQALGIHRNTLLTKLEQLNIKRGSQSEEGVLPT